MLPFARFVLSGGGEGETEREREREREKREREREKKSVMRFFYLKMHDLISAFANRRFAS
jgi:hypothetical protein